MVRHTHQDFLPEIELVGLQLSSMPVCHDKRTLATVMDFSRGRDLFDEKGHCARKISLSYLDTFIDDRKDWENLCVRLCGVNILYLVDDREITNPVMREYAVMKNAQYVIAFAMKGITCSMMDE